MHPIVYLLIRAKFIYFFDQKTRQREVELEHAWKMKLNARIYIYVTSLLELHASRSHALKPLYINPSKFIIQSSSNQPYINYKVSQPWQFQKLTTLQPFLSFSLQFLIVKMCAIQNARLKNPSTATILLPSTELDFHRTLLSVRLLPRTRYTYIYFYRYKFFFLEKNILKSNTIDCNLFNQIEGAAHRALNGWDYYTHRYPGYKPINYLIDLTLIHLDIYMGWEKSVQKELVMLTLYFSVCYGTENVPDRSSGDLACDSYHLYKVRVCIHDIQDSCSNLEINIYLTLEQFIYNLNRRMSSY